MNSAFHLTFGRPSDDSLLIRLSGEWTIEHGLPRAEDVHKEIESGPSVRQVSFDTEGLTAWDSGLLTFLTKVNEQCAAKDVQVDEKGLPEGVQRLLALAVAVPEQKDARKVAIKQPFLHRVGASAIAFIKSAAEMIEFMGEAFLVFVRLLRGKTRLRRSDLFLFIQQSGAEALPIVSLISFLVGLILAFVAATQLKVFGAQIFVADLVGIAMVRVMAAVMTGTIMAGRTGASFAAQIGTMQVNEEIDALKTMGISPMEFLVLPRMLALVIMMPLLCLYADLVGILGGALVGVGMLDLGLMEYYHQTKAGITMTFVWIGLFHAAVFGILIALSGCLRGMQCGRSASAVGEATTSAVVTAIVSMVIATAIITGACYILGI
jgi:phospholipid/cholesterol/gamma-HCH transport system permease protein